jgi:hypothetical protein
MQAKILSPALQDMPAAGAVRRDEVQVITGHIQRFRVLGSPEAHESPRDIFKFELRLNCSRLELSAK